MDETWRAISEIILTSGSPEGSVIDAVPNFITSIGFDTLVVQIKQYISARIHDQ